MAKTFRVGRDPGNGRFITIKKAKNNPEKYIIERVPTAGNGDTK